MDLLVLSVGRILGQSWGPRASVEALWWLGYLSTPFPFVWERICGVCLFPLLLSFGGKSRVCICCPVPSLAWSQPSNSHNMLLACLFQGPGTAGLGEWTSLSAEALPFLLSVLGIERRTCPCWEYTATGQLVHGFLFFLTHSFSTHEEVAPRLLSPWFLPHSGPHVLPYFLEIFISKKNHGSVCWRMMCRGQDPILLLCFCSVLFCVLKQSLTIWPGTCHTVWTRLVSDSPISACPFLST